MRKKTTLAILGGFFILGVMLVGQQFLLKNEVQNASPSPTERQYAIDNVTPTVRLQQKQIAVLVDFGNGRKLDGGVVAVNAYEALAILAKERNIEVSAKEYKFGRMVEAVDSVKNSNFAAWSYSVNGKLGQIAADRQTVNPNDTVMWEYKKLN